MKKKEQSVPSLSSNAVKKLKDAFLNKFVIIYLENMQVSVPAEDGSGVQMTAMVEGFVVDIDTDFYYLGLEDGTILQTVPHKSTGPVELATKMEDDFSNLFGEIEDDGGFH